LRASPDLSAWQTGRRVPRHWYLGGIQFSISLFQLKFLGNIDFFALFCFPYFLLDQKVTKSQGFLKKAKIRRAILERRNEVAYFLTLLYTVVRLLTELRYTLSVAFLPYFTLPDFLTPFLECRSFLIFVFDGAWGYKPGLRASPDLSAWQTGRRVPRHCYLVIIRFFASLFQLKFHSSEFIRTFLFS